MAEKKAKNIQFPDEVEYLELTFDAKRNKMTIGEFILMCYSEWKKTNQSSGKNK